MTVLQEVTWLAVCELAVIPVGAGAAALLPDGTQVAIFRPDDDAVFALSNVDPFSGAAVLSRGILGDSEGTPVVASPMHKQRFDLRTGECLEDAEVRVRSFAVQVSDGIVRVASP